MEKWKQISGDVLHMGGTHAKFEKNLRQKVAHENGIFGVFHLAPKLPVSAQPNHLGYMARHPSTPQMHGNMESGALVDPLQGFVTDI